MAATIQQVAELAHVHVSTVSRVFSRPEMISAATRARVEQAAVELGWRPNPMARALITGQTRNIGVMVPDIANPFFPPLVKAAQREAWRWEHCLFLADSEENPEQEHAALLHLASQVDGLVLVSSRLPETTILELAAGHPVVLVNRTVPGISAVLIDSASGM